MAPKKKMETSLERENPPTMSAAAQVSTMNGSTLFKIFNRLKNEEDDEMLEKVVHYMSIHSRLHNQVVSEAMLPLLKKSKEGKVFAQKMMDKTMELEGMLNELDKTKKHLDNEEFIQLMTDMEESCSEAADLENEALAFLEEELEEDALEKAAAKMEHIKMKAPLKMAAA